jgi:dual specificity phosphatase 3
MRTEALDSLSIETWWRTPCHVTPRIVLSGDLDPRARAAQLDTWIALGVTDIIDLRSEASDERFVADCANHITYHHIGTDDDGYSRPLAWFDDVVCAGITALADPDRIVVIHCHMGVNRAPSAAFALLLELGHNIEDALELIRRARPIAAIHYATDALSWWQQRHSVETTKAAAQRAVLQTWMLNNPLDTGHIISTLHQAGWA